MTGTQGDTSASEPVERDVMEYDVVTVGAGPAGLAFAIRLKQLNPDISVCVIEKASTVGAQILSGAVIEPAPLDALLPGWRNAPPPICVQAGEDELWYLSKDRAHKFPIVPPGMHNHGNFIVSLGALCAWLAPQAEALGVEIYPGFAAADTLHADDGSVIGVRIGDMGVAKDGTHKPGYTPGIDIHAKVTVLAEGARGHLTKRLIQRFALDAGHDPQAFSIGIKELWQLPAGRVTPGKIVHTLGWPADNTTYGGSFLYHLEHDQVALGYVSGLDYRDPAYQPWEAFQQWKNHPMIRPLLEGGTIVSAGARAIASGGWQSLPKVEMPGALLIGDTAGLLNVPKIKGTHQAIRSGMLAAEHLASSATLDPAGFDARLRSSQVMAELRQVRNIKPGFKKGLWFGLFNAAWETLVKGASPWTLKVVADWKTMNRLDEHTQPKRDYVQRELAPRDRLQGVYFAATEHEEDQPVHLRVRDPQICVTRCTEEYGNPCTRFCPASVYEIVDDAAGKRLQINAANCVHCKTCDIKDPYAIIDWVTPEGGSGPNYQNL
ncbi:electron transfer flavoprotein-ubiquinone oxidoreductase [Xanthomonas albilineans]|uniref:Electron transfer flavoprotein-ubiquinone oxidoreductase n=1 Tax=Xanthomonas albilineans (strain GPE PC73 / CFBP 7063) TaxID=380358 RepID=D2UFK4_XANAP|nr:electron transfer flavoprotein-ubiquinone oxidoreductase [Xanthomonas albilineans]QHQ29414.1 putative flavoprotein-ubiquinone oxidoreductase [Xanthomonas albilineans]CBA17165.1 putative flavoprotein-ubiquinone oxidoreductase [Xanthomonas albilineans GPE PC73]